MRSLGLSRLSSLAFMSLGALATYPNIAQIEPRPEPMRGRQRYASANSYGGVHTRTTGPMGLNGKREVARRMRQIAAGQLQVSA